MSADHERQAGPAERGDPTRKLTAILSADVVGYSRLMGADETGTHGRLKALRAAIDPLLEARGGRITGAAGDGILVDFGSVVGAIRAAVEVQRELATRNRDLPAPDRMELRIGINLGDVIVDGDEIFGDGVNIAARLQALGDPGGILISGGVHEQIRHKLDLVFQDRGSHRVKNIVDPVHVYAIELDPAGQRPAGSRRRVVVAVSAALAMLLAGLGVWFAPALLLELGGQGEQAAPQQASQRPRIAVLPFENRSSDSEDDYFSDGVTEDIITELSRFPDLIVMPWSAVEPFKQQNASTGAVEQAFGVRYVVEGSIRRANDQIRATVQLSDAQGAGVIWSERYEEPFGEIFALQDRIVRRIVSALATRLTLAEQQRSTTKPTESLEAYDLLLRGRVAYGRAITRAATFEAQKLFERAVALDPDYGAAYAWLARTHIQAAEHGWVERPAAAFATSADLLQKAIRLDPDNANAHALLATVYFWQLQDERALAEARRAVTLNPNDVATRSRAGIVFLLLGETEAGLAGLERAVADNPSPHPSHLSDLALAYILTDQIAAAVATVERNITRDPEAEHPFGWIVAAATYALAGRQEQAKEAAERVRRLDPFFSAEQFSATFRNPEDGRKLEEALAAAGLG